MSIDADLEHLTIEAEEGTQDYRSDAVLRVVAEVRRLRAAVDAEREACIAIAEGVRAHSEHFGDAAGAKAADEIVAHIQTRRRRNG